MFVNAAVETSSVLFDRLSLFRLDRHLKALFERHERVLMPASLVIGFAIDLISFRSLRLQTTFLLLAAHALIAMVAIAYMHVFDGRAGKRHGAVASYFRFSAPLVLQFSFGALLSSSLVCYWFSGTFSASWPIFALLVVLMVSNELFRHFLLRPVVQFSIYSFVLFSFATLLFPFVFHSLSPLTFMLGGAASTLFVLAIIFALARIAPAVGAARRRLALSAAAVFIIMNSLYFLNVIPPIPLFIREAGIYRDIRRVGGEYVFEGEEESFLARMVPGQVVRGDADGRVYAYSAIFAPVDLRTVIVHEWQYYDAETARWATHDRLSYPINGGREAGYRGYTYQTNLASGRWRVHVETTRGQRLGTIPFAIER